MNSQPTSRPDGVKASRRTFLAATAAATVGLATAPRLAPGQAPPGERVNLAGIGVGGMGGGDIATFARLGCNIVALCDVDEARAAGSFNAFPKARRYKDFREMLDKEAKNIDAVTRRHAGPHPRRRRDGGDPGRQARLRARSRSPTRCTNAAS